MEREKRGRREKQHTMEELALMWKLAGMPYKLLRVMGTMYPSKESAGAVWLFLT
jgi:hypothetical protein